MWLPVTNENDMCHSKIKAMQNQCSSSIPAPPLGQEAWSPDARATGEWQPTLAEWEVDLYCDKSRDSRVHLLVQHNWTYPD